MNYSGSTSAQQPRTGLLRTKAAVNLLPSRQTLGNIWEGVKFHAPRIRQLDTLVGGTVGALAGLGTEWATRPDDPEQQKGRQLKYLLGGAALGAAGGNLVGDRARRYLSNTLPIYGYGDSDAFQAAKPTWDKVYTAGILDRPYGPPPSKTLAEEKFTPAAVSDLQERLQQTGQSVKSMPSRARYELLRHGMKLPVRGPAVLRSIGSRQFEPNKFSGGFPGTYDAYELDPNYRSEHGASWDDFFSNSGNFQTLKKMHEQNPNAPFDSGWQSVIGLNKLLSRHKVDWVNPNLVQLSDLWDFAPDYGEPRVARQILSDVMKNPTGAISTLKQPLTDQDWSVMGLANDAQNADWTRWDFLKHLAARAALNKLLPNGGAMFQQDVNVSKPTYPKFLSVYRG